MTAKDLISDIAILVPPSATGIEALNLMDELNVTHLPVVEGTEYLGLISLTEMYNREEPALPAWDGKTPIVKPFIFEDQHVYDAIVLFSEQKLSLLPVLNSRNQFAGVATVGTLVEKLPFLASLDQPGSIIVLEVNQKDYLLTEIAGIVESNDSKILSLYVSSHPNSTRLEVTLKVNVTDIGAILQTFSRYNYMVSASWSKADSFTEGLQDRFDSLMNYLNI